MSRDEVAIVDIRNAAQLALEFIVGTDHQSFVADIKTQSAVLHQLLVMGEAVKRLSDRYRSANPSVPWKAMAGMRDKLIHDYDSVDVELVWETLENDIPGVIDQLNQILIGNESARHGDAN